MRNRAIQLATILLLPIVLFMIFTLSAKGFGLHSIPIILSQSMLPTVMAFGMCMIMNTGPMDFSVGARSIFAAVMGGLLAQRMGAFGMVIGCLAGGIIGAVMMAILYDRLKIPAMVISLGVIMIYEVLGAKIAGSSGYIRINSNIYSLMSYPNNLMLSFVAGIICYIVMYRTKIGSNMIAVGNDELMCKNVGINPARIKLMAFILSGVFTSIAGILLLCYSGSVSASTGMASMSTVFKPLMCILIARQLRNTMDNMPLLILIGGICLTIIFNGFIALGFSDALQDVTLGLFMIVLMSHSGNAKALKEWRRRRKIARVLAS